MNDALARLLALDLPGSLLVLTHDNPDPDSLSSACALRHLLLERRGKESVVGYSGIVGRAENRAMVERLGLELRPVTRDDLASFDHIALIDAQPYTGNSVVPDGRAIDIVVDHHPLRESTALARFYDVRPDVGASATLLTEYLRRSDTPIPAPLATALLYGIRTETRDLSRDTSAADRDAYHFLFPLADPALLAAIATPPLHRGHYEHVARALSRAAVAGPVLLCSLDEVPDPDFVPEMADYFVRMQGIVWVLVHGEFAGRMHLSIRTGDDDMAHAGAAMRELLRGIGLGGGHGSRAGGAIDLRAGERDRDEIALLLQQRFLEMRGITATPLEPLVTPDVAPERRAGITIANRGVS